MQSVFVFLDITKYADFRWKKYWYQQNSSGVSRNLYCFWIFFRQGITVPTFIILRYMWQILGRDLFAPHPWAARKRPSWIGLSANYTNRVIVFDHFLGLALKELIEETLCFQHRAHLSHKSILTQCSTSIPPANVRKPKVFWYI